MKRFIIFCATACTVLLLSNSSNALADTGSQLKQQINQIDKEKNTALNSIQSNQKALKSNQIQQSAIVSQVQALQSQIESSNYKIQVKQDSILATEDGIQSLKQNISALETRIKERKGLIAVRARSVYVNDNSTNYLQLVVDSTNFYDLIDRIIFVNKIANQDQSILEQQVSDQDALTKDQQALQDTLKQLDQDLNSLKQMRATLDQDQLKEQNLLKQLKSKAAEIQLAVSTQQAKAALYQQQEEAHKNDLSAWESAQTAKKQTQAYQAGNSSLPFDVKQFVGQAEALNRSTGVPAAITLAQATLESDDGGQLSELATLGKNLFGIKGSGPAGTIYLPTQEVIGGTVITINAGFKKYQTYYQCMVDHAAILNTPRYQYFLSGATNLQEYAYGIQDGGYATDPNYAAKLLSVIQAYGLAQYDTGSF